MVNSGNKICNAISVLIILFISAFCIIELQGQRFSAKAIIGVNTSQVDGDELYGYNKIGLQAGASLSYPFNNVVDVSLEMLYCQRGSQDGFGIGGNDLDKLRLSLDYISFPVLFEMKFINDKLNESHKVKVYPGIAYSYLIYGSSPRNSVQDAGNFKKSDISYLVGISYALSNSVWIGMRYTRGLDGIINIPARGEDGLISYFLNFRIEIEI